MKKKFKNFIIAGSILTLPIIASVVLSSCNSSETTINVNNNELKEINKLIQESLATVNNPRTEGVAKQTLKQNIEKVLIKQQLAVIDSKLEINKDANNKYLAFYSFKLSKNVTLDSNEYFNFQNDYLITKKSFELSNFNPGTTKSVNISATFINDVGATSGTSINAAGYASLNYDAATSKIIVLPQHTGDTYYSIILPNQVVKGALEGAGLDGLKDNDFIKYDLVQKDPDLVIENNVLFNKNPLNMNKEISLKGTVFGSDYVEFNFKLKLTRTINTTKNFVPVGTSSDQAVDGNKGDIVAKNDHDIINVVSNNEASKFFNFNLPNKVKNNLFSDWSNPFPENSKIEYSPITATQENPFSLTKEGVVTNANAVVGPITLHVHGKIVSSSNPEHVAEIDFELIISPKLNIVINNNFIANVESSTDQKTFTKGSVTISGSTINIKPANPKDKYFKITLPTKVLDGMFSGLDSTKYPTNSKINYGPIYSSNNNLNYNSKPDAAFATGPVIFNKPNKPLSSSNNKFNINVFIYDKDNANPIKIPLIILFNI